MIAALCHRITASTAENLTLECEVLDALKMTFGAEDPDFFCRHGRGLIGNLTNVEHLLAAMLPGARWDLRNTFCGTSLCLAVVDTSDGADEPFSAMAKVAANALLAATLRAYAGAREPLKVAVNDDFPAAPMLAANDGRRAEA